MNAPDHSIVNPSKAADVLLAAALRHRARRVFIEPASSASHRVVFHRHGRPVASAFLPLPLGPSVIERFRFIAELDPTAGKHQSATWPLVARGSESRVFLTTSGEGDGARAEMWFLDAADEPEAELAPLMDVTHLGPGSTIGPLHLGAMLGGGGMGVVYRARHKWLDRECAVKVLRPEISLDPGSLEQFFREARLAARTQSDGSVNIMDVGTLPDGRPYIVMELIEGESLEELVASGGPLEPIRAARIVRETARALSVLHARGVVHCDLSASNVFVAGEAPNESVKIVDFGLARIDEEQERHDEMVYGTPFYMAPEQIRGARCDARTDLYALGVCLFELVTGQPPFDGSTAIEIVRRHLDTEAPVPTTPWGTLPPALTVVIRTLLAKNPGSRFQSAAELVQALDPIIARASGKRTAKVWLSAVG